MQKLFILYLFLNATISFSQNLEPAVFAKVNTFRHTGFEDNIFADGTLGVSLFSTYWISPKISFKRTEDDITRLTLQERINSKNYNSWFDLSTGVEFYFDNNERFLTSVYLTYTLLDLGSGFEKLSFENTTKRPPSKNNSTIGLGVSIEYCFCKKNQD